MNQIILATFTGALFGVVFTLLKLPLPAPTAWAGIFGILGVYLGYLLIKSLGL